MRSSSDFLNHNPEGFPHLTFAEALDAIRIDLNFHRQRIVEINKLLSAPVVRTYEEKRLMHSQKEYHKRAVTRIERTKRSLLFGDFKR